MNGRQGSTPTHLARSAQVVLPRPAQHLSPPLPATTSCQASTLCPLMQPAAPSQPLPSVSSNPTGAVCVQHVANGQLTTGQCYTRRCQDLNANTFLLAIVQSAMYCQGCASVGSGTTCTKVCALGVALPRLHPVRAAPQHMPDVA